MPKIKIIGEIHYTQESEKYSSQATALARSGCIILAYENKIFDDYKDGLIENNIYATEDLLIYGGYVRIIRSISNLYGPTSPSSIYDHNMLLSLFAYEIFGFLTTSIRCSVVQPSIYKITCELYKTIKGKNTPLEEAINLATNYSVYASECSKPGWQNNLPEEYLIPFRNNLSFWRNTLLTAANLFSDHILQDHNYSELIRRHKALSKEWINGYFERRFIKKGGVFLDDSPAIVDLRNQIFVERLAKISHMHSAKDIVFIVGEDHLSGLEQLFLQQHKEIQLEVIRGTCPQITKNTVSVLYE